MIGLTAPTFGAGQPAATGHVQATAGEWRTVLHVIGAHLGHRYQVRLYAPGTSWRIIVRGNAGWETFASGTILPGVVEATRLTLVPDVGGAELIVQVTATATDVGVRGEMTWRIVDPEAGRPAAAGRQ